MKIAVLTAADGARWESDLLADLARVDLGIQIVRRCVDVIDLLAVAGAGVGAAVLVDAQLRRFDAAVVERLQAAELAVIGVVQDGSEAERELFRAAGVSYIVPAEASAEVVADLIESAVGQAGAAPTADRAYADPTSTAGRHSPGMPGDELVVAPVGAAGPAAQHGSVIAVWGPTGAPGRSTVALALADELSRLSVTSMLIDADVYGGVHAAALGLLDESPGLAAACRQAQARRLDAAALAALAWQISPNFRVLTGIQRADRWPELRPTGMDTVLDVSRQLAQFTVVDLSFCLETDEELSFDTIAPRRNGATLAILDRADLILVVGSADPIGMHRLIRGMSELREAGIDSPVWIVVNRVRGGPVPGEPRSEIDAALQRFTGQSAAAMLPLDVEGLDATLRAGKTLAEVAPGSPMRRAVVELAEAVAGVSPRPRRRWRR